jgi:hypothetical protein
MTIELIGVIALVFGVAGLFLDSTFIVYVFFCSTLLGSAGAVILTALGGTNIQPAHLLLGFLILRLMRDRAVRDGALRAISIGQPGFWLLMTMLYSTVSAYLMPRLFAGETMAFAVRATMGLDNSIAPLEPTTSNLTQSIYFIGNFICFVVLCGFASSLSGRKHLARAALACVSLNLVFVVLDLVTYLTNTADLLAFIRNATYQTMAESDVAGVKRIVGSFVEASTFGYWTLGYFAFATSLWLNGIATRLTLPLCLLSLVALLCSTSSTAYVGLMVFLFVQYCIIGLKFISRPVKIQKGIFIIAVPFIVVLVVVLIAMNDTTSAIVGDVLDNLLFNKLSTSSGIERSNWNSQAIRNFIDTFGFGAGNGSVRASSFPVAVISSLGVIGSTTYALFLVPVLFGQNGTSDTTMVVYQNAARSACFAWLIAASLSGGFIDLGLSFFAFAALACTDPRSFRVRSREKLPSQSFDGFPTAGLEDI